MFFVIALYLVFFPQAFAHFDTKTIDDPVENIHPVCSFFQEFFKTPEEKDTIFDKGSYVQFEETIHFPKEMTYGLQPEDRNTVWSNTVIKNFQCNADQLSFSWFESNSTKHIVNEYPKYSLGIMRHKLTHILDSGGQISTVINPLGNPGRNTTLVNSRYRFSPGEKQIQILSILFDEFKCKETGEENCQVLSLNSYRIDEAQRRIIERGYLVLQPRDRLGSDPATWPQHLPMQVFYPSASFSPFKPKPKKKEEAPKIPISQRVRDFIYSLPRPRKKPLPSDQNTGLTNGTISSLENDAESTN